MRRRMATLFVAGVVMAWVSIHSADAAQNTCPSPGDTLTLGTFGATCQDGPDTTHTSYPVECVDGSHLYGNGRVWGYLGGMAHANQPGGTVGFRDAVAGCLG